MKTLTHQDLTDLVEGAAIFSAGGGGDTLIGHSIVERLIEKRCKVCLIDPSEVPDNETVVNFACVGATANAAYHSDAAVKTLEALEQFLGRKAYAILPVELGGLNTLAAVDVAARHGIPVVDADGAGRAVPEVHLKVYTLDNIPLAPMAIADLDAENVVLVKQTRDLRSAERIARNLASEWNQMVYTARRVLTGKQTKASPILHTLSKSIRVGMLLRKTVDPLKAVLTETRGFKLFEGAVNSVKRETQQGFTWTTLKLKGKERSKDSELELIAKNEFLIAHKNGELLAMAPDIITAVSPVNYKCLPAEKIIEDNRLVLVGIPVPQKWRSLKGLKLWREVLLQSGIKEKYVPVRRLASET